MSVDAEMFAAAAAEIAAKDAPMEFIAQPVSVLQLVGLIQLGAPSSGAARGSARGSGAVRQWLARVLRRLSVGAADYRRRRGSRAGRLVRCAGAAVPEGGVVMPLEALGGRKDMSESGSVYVPFSPSQLMALQDLVLDYVMRPGRLEAFIDAARGVETTPEDLLQLLVGAERPPATEVLDPLVPDLVAAIGADGAGRIALKVVPVGSTLVPLVAVVADAGRVRHLAAKMQGAADRTSSPIRLARFGYIEDLVELRPITDDRFRPREPGRTDPL